MKTQYFHSACRKWYYAVTTSKNIAVFNVPFVPSISIVSVCPTSLNDCLIECSEQEFENIKADVLDTLEHQIDDESDEFESTIFPDYAGL